MTVPEPRHTNEQLLTEATGRVETEMGRLREAAALKKAQRFMSRPDSSKSTYCENHNLPELQKKKLEFPRRLSVTRKPREPLAA